MQSRDTIAQIQRKYSREKKVKDSSTKGSVKALSDTTNISQPKLHQEAAAEADVFAFHDTEHEVKPCKRPKRATQGFKKARVAQQDERFVALQHRPRRSAKGCSPRRQERRTQSHVCSNSREQSSLTLMALETVLHTFTTPD